MPIILLRIVGMIFLLRLYVMIFAIIVSSCVREAISSCQTPSYVSFFFLSVV
jgi:hypothetical protein